jgi:hypothetical protein
MVNRAAAYNREIESASARSPRSVILAGLAIVIVFLALNYRAYDGFFQDDELDTLS